MLSQNNFQNNTPNNIQLLLDCPEEIQDSLGTQLGLLQSGAKIWNWSPIGIVIAKLLQHTAVAEAIERGLYVQEVEKIGLTYHLVFETATTIAAEVSSCFCFCATADCFGISIGRIDCFVMAGPTPSTIEVNFFS